jgi:hypothetical protein
LLARSWFFRIFTVVALLFLSIFNSVLTLGSELWAAKAIASNIPYVNLLFLNTGQAIIAIFLASDFLKRDKKLDTSEVFYVRPLSNAAYVTGKIWGNLRVFLLLNLVVMAISVIFTFMSPGLSVDWPAYAAYFFLISIPTLVYIIGLSVFLMLVLKNQALTFIILLGYIGLTLFYIHDKFYYLFDYMVYYLPLLKSSIVGFTNLGAILIHRSIYLFAGLAFIFFTISLFRRLPNSSRSNYPWLILGICMLFASVWAGYTHVGSIMQQKRMRLVYTGVNNKYVHAPKMIIDRYDIAVEQHPSSFSAKATLTGVALQTSRVFTFCLNPGLQVQEIKKDGRLLNFQREEQIISVDMGKETAQGDTVSLSIAYHGKTDNNFCYLDIPEDILQEEYRHVLFSVDKQYGFQTENYMLLTPETYWYPRPGTAYSSESPDWQQNYFSRFTLAVKPLSGLIPLSQGAGISGEDGVFSFQPEYPAQAISLITGKYEQNSIEADGIRYDIWHIKGHDFYTAAIDSVRDTIPALIRNVKEDFERAYQLDYPFKSFSVIEVPAQFYSYPHAWSQAQEVVQPAMALFTEKGWIYDEVDIATRQKRQMRWANRQITEKEALVRALNDAMHVFIRTEGRRNFSQTGRGQISVARENNPYFQFPQLYNFRYNIFSHERPVANRAIELYLQNKPDNSAWERDYNGISNNEKANLLMEKQSFRELLANTEYRDLSDHVISLMVKRLFARAEINVGVETFRDSVYSMLQRNSFRNLRFEELLDDLGKTGHDDIRSGLSEWDRPATLPVYSIGQPEATKVISRGQETFILKTTVSNNSDNDGIIQMNIRTGDRQRPVDDPRANRKIALAARQTKQLVSLWTDEPREVTINTIVSGNLPNTISQPVRNTAGTGNKSTEQEGDYLLSGSAPDTWGEIIVDNEDSLFHLSKPVTMGLLPKWLDKVEDTSFKYAGIYSRRRSVNWMATTNVGYYGKHIRSAYVVRSGNGNRTATWKVPVPDAGNYEVYYFAGYVDGETKSNYRPDSEYRFKIEYGNDAEDAYINLQNAGGGWEQLGTYYFGADTVRITLTNECKCLSVTADAVKLVRK